MPPKALRIKLEELQVLQMIQRNLVNLIGKKLRELIRMAEGMGKDGRR